MRSEGIYYLLHLKKKGRVFVSQCKATPRDFSFTFKKKKKSNHKKSRFVPPPKKENLLYEHSSLFPPPPPLFPQGFLMYPSFICPHPVPPKPRYEKKSNFFLKKEI
eukprot:TRINITY_DN4055_c0_g1_i6.p1 TRINITY_DN4055_c0_g1~~TRINITY_DN4055_c0_g1_i6.p1  ORF type:complete len:106 (+),score=5.63 TRINITY_DN4055_c0_g1_i6:88-405(+)